MRLDRRYVRGREALPEVHKACPEVREGSGGLPEVREGVGAPSQRSGTGRRTLMEVRDGSGDLPEGP